MIEDVQNVVPGELVVNVVKGVRARYSKSSRTAIAYLGTILFCFLFTFVANTANATSFNVPASGSSTVTVTGGDGIYDSGGPGGAYGNNQDGTLTLSPATAGQKVRLTFSAFATESCCDYVQIFDGPSTGSTLLGTYYGSTLPSAFTSTASGGELTIRLVSEVSGVDGGFAAVVSLIGGASGTGYNVPSTGSSTVTVTTDDGIYDSGGPGGDYGNNQSGSLTLMPATAGKMVSIAFSALSTESCCDYVQIFDGPSTSGTLLGTFAGTTIPGAFTSTDASGALTVLFYSDVSAISSGFAATVLLVDPPPGTQYIVPTSGSSTVTVTDDDGIYDNGGAYGSYGVSQDGSLTLLPLTAGKKVRLTFTAFSTESCCDYLQIFDGPSTGSALLGTFLGSTLPSTFTSTASGGALTVRFFTDDGVVGPGFAATVSLIGTPVAASLSSQVNVLCNGGSTGSATVSASGGTPGYTYSWAPSGGSAATASSLAAGTYTCTVTDAASGTATVSVTITQPSALSASISSVTNVSCNGGSDGAATATASGGTAGYTYAWTPSGGTAATATGRAAGSYTCTVTDANSCTTTAVATVTQPSVIVPNVFVVSNVACFGGATGSVSTGASGGTGSYTYSWSTGNTGSSIAGVPAGTYTCTVFDQNGCNVPGSATVTQPTALTASVSSVTNVSCNGGSNGAATVTASGGAGGYTYVWAPSGGTASTATGVTSGSYTCTVTDANSCTTAAVASITQPSVLTASVTSVTNIACFGASTGAATVTAGGGAGGYTYSWAPSGGTAVTATGRPAGSYTCTVTDANSCMTTTVATVTQPSTPVSISSISGGTYCVGNTINLSVTGVGGVGGYTYSWSGPMAFSSTSANPSIGSATTGRTGTYTVTVTDANGCSATGTVGVTVNTNPGASSGSAFTCAGGSITLSNATGSGTWSSSNSSIATVGSLTGVVTGVAAGSVDITYSLGSGCFSVKSLDVNPPMPEITGTTNVCIGTTTDLDDSMAGGTWSTSSSYFGSVDPTTGVVTGNHPGGYTTVTYSVNSGCNTTASVYTSNIVLSVAGSLTVCEGAVSTLSVPGYPGAQWHTPDSATVFINQTSGAMLGISAGSVPLTVTYGYCFTTATASVNPVPASITGGSEVCMGSTLSLACSTGGGAWSSSNTAKATVDGSGTVTGVAAGTATISYALGTGCAATKVVTVGGMPAAISGTTTLCEGATTNLACTSTGGTWSSSATGTADVTATTVTGFASYATISGIAAGVATVSYSYPGGCVQTVNVTVAAPPSAIGGALDICVGGTSTLTGSGGGSWSSSTTTVATIGSSTGIVTAGATSGTSTITYRTSATCYTTAVVTVGVPAAISGASSVCKTYSTTFTHGVGGGTWSSSNAAVASVDASGVVTGVLAGSANITYNISTGCYAVKNIYVYNNPAAITGTAAVCAGANTTLTGASGTTAVWSSSDGGVATVGSSSGVVTGVSAGNADITFTATATGCFSTRNVTVNEAPAAITGASTLCVGANEAYVSTPTGGAWASTAPTVGSINATSGVATGRAAGGTYIKYTLSNGCYVLKAVTVTALPGGIVGTSIVCVGNTVVLSAASAGSTWSTSASGTASITATTASTATVAGVSTGVANISYSNAAGCSRVYTVTVNAAVADIAGDDVVCSAGTITLTDATAGGTWSSNATGKVSVAAYTGVATGGATLGTAVITYKVGLGCYATKSITNNAALPNILGGASYMCSGEDAAVTLTNAVSGGTWSSSNTSVAVVDGSGVVTGVLMGGSNTYVYITYATSAGCTKSRAILIKPQPIITGAEEVSVGATTTMTGSPTGGSWGSSSTATAYITGYGIVYGIAAGSATISYTVAGCVNTKGISVTGGAASRPAGMTEEAVTLFSVFPNPSHGTLSVSTGVAGTFAIYTVDGKLAATSELTEGVNAISMPMNLASGTYLCRFNGVDGSVQSVRLVYEP